MSSGSLRLTVEVTMLSLGVIFASAGALAIWWGTNGIVVNEFAFHVGASTPAEMINNGTVLLAVGAATLITFVGLFIVKKDFLKFSDAKF
jgi:hypothetical protein